MRHLHKLPLAATLLALAGAAAAQVVFYENEDFRGRSFTANGAVQNFADQGFNDRASSIRVERGNWEVCQDSGFAGRCVMLREGGYPTLAAMGLQDRVSSVRRADDNRGRDAAGSNAGHVVFFENENFRGRTFTVNNNIPSFSGQGFNDRASSIRVTGGTWQVCEDTGFAGRCANLRAGDYPTLAAMGLQDRISSVRRLDDDRGRNDQPPYSSQWQRRGNERLYEANVQSVRAVMGPPEQRCWVERQAVEVERRDNRPGGAILGAVLGGVLGHQIGNGSGRDLATVGGVVAGAAVGSQIARNRNDGPQLATQDVQRCRDVPNSSRTDYWDVTYSFRGQGHRVQLSQPPGPTITVNRQGEPREQPRS